MQAEGVYTYAGYKPIYREELFLSNSDEYPRLKDFDYNNLKMPNTDNDIEIKDGRYGAYVTEGKINATIPKSEDVNLITKIITN